MFIYFLHAGTICMLYLCTVLERSFRGFCPLVRVFAGNSLPLLPEVTKRV